MVKLSLRVANNLAIKERKWPLLSSKTCERTNTSFVYKRPRTGLEMNGNELLGILSRRRIFSQDSLIIHDRGPLEEVVRTPRAPGAERQAWNRDDTRHRIQSCFDLLLHFMICSRHKNDERLRASACLHSKSPAFITDAETETRINSIFTRHKIMLWEDAPMLNGSCRAILLHLHIRHKVLPRSHAQIWCRETHSDKRP